MKVKITAQDFAYPVGTIVEVGDAAPAGWAGKCEPVADARKRPIPPATTSPVSGDGKPPATTSPVRGDD